MVPWGTPLVTNVLPHLQPFTTQDYVRLLRYDLNYSPLGPVIPQQSSLDSSKVGSTIATAFLKSRSTTALMLLWSVFNDQLSVASSKAVTVE